MVEKLVADPFTEKLKLTVTLNQQSEMLQSLVLVHVRVEVYIETKELTTCFYLTSKFSEK